MFEKYKKSLESITVPVDEQPQGDLQTIKKSLTDNLIYLQERFGSSFDFVIRRSDISGQKIAFLFLDGMCNSITMLQSIIKPVMEIREIPRKQESLFEYIRDYISVSADQSECHSLQEVEGKLMAGFLVMFVDGEEKCLAFSVQGFAKRAVSDPMTDVQERGSHEGFVDNFKDNITLVRRRLQTTDLCFEEYVIGETSKTKVILCYLNNRVNSGIIDDVRTRLDKIVVDSVLGSGILVPFLDIQDPSLFSAVGVTERPDVFSAKLTEGKVGLIIDGTPHALYVPMLFTEEFSSLDDYLGRPYFALFLRFVKLTGFLIGILLPGIYVAVGTFHQELFPADLLFDIATAESRTPLPLPLEAIVIHLIYEIVREAGIRMPKVVGHTVSIVGALVIGDAAVTAGLIAAPMLIIVALTAICSAIVSSLHQASAILRFSFIIIGGTLGFYGIMLALGVITVNLCSMNPYGIVFTSPLSPFNLGAVRDTLFRSSWKTLGRRQIEIGKMKDFSEN